VVLVECRKEVPLRQELSDLVIVMAEWSRQRGRLLGSEGLVRAGTQVFSLITCRWAVCACFMLLLLQERAMCMSAKLGYTKPTKRTKKSVMHPAFPGVEENPLLIIARLWQSRRHVFGTTERGDRQLAVSMRLGSRPGSGNPEADDGLASKATT
jgi:hypothetical protein